MEKIVQYKVLDKIFGDEQSAKIYEEELISKLRKFDNYDEIWMFDYINDRIIHSRIKKARINEYNYVDPVEYIIDGFDNPAVASEIFLSLDDLIESLKSNIKHFV